MIEVSGLTKQYGHYVAVDGVTFAVARGELVGFLGPNGAGKSTTLRMLAGYLGPTRGRIVVAGHDLAVDPERAKRALGYLPETCPLYPEMRVTEYLRFRASLKGVPRRLREGHVLRAVAQTQLVDVCGVRIGELSKGYRQRVGIADALVADPPVLILDEPTAGLDPNQIREVRTLLKELAEEKAILLSTHILGEVDAICTRVLVLAKGKLVAEGPIAELTRQARTVGTGLRFRGRADLAQALTLGFPEIAKAVVVERDDEQMLCLYWRADASGVASEAVVEALVDKLIAAKLKVRGTVELAEREGTGLEAVFASLTRADAGALPESAEETR